ncbi:hypothetical protein F7D09_1770 [Bifidobacterium leontopitheci]|uniref:Tmp1 n=2 Tax=Bifidobacterium leontopitheci TaxID=2650774 RepID=A0A6I1GDL3_9BIFI|nr:hypothetical protein F7D09_1770 [Bifidobacterium leontopitheci]
MTVSQQTASQLAVARCGTVSALTLGLPAKCAIPAQKGALPKGLFVAKAPVSAKLKQRLANDIVSITMLALLRPANTGAEPGSGKVPEVLVLGLRLAAGVHDVPVEVVDLIAGQRKSGIVFVCVRDGEFEGTTREECAFAVRRNVPVRAGHIPVTKVFAGAWKPAGEATLEVPADAGAVGVTMDGLWDGLCAQAILDSADGRDLDARIARRDQIATLKAAEAKLARDHQRAKSPGQRNEIYAKLHKVRTQLAGFEA